MRCLVSFGCMVNRYNCDFDTYSRIVLLYDYIIRASGRPSSRSFVGKSGVPAIHCTLYMDRFVTMVQTFSIWHIITIDDTMISGVITYNSGGCMV